MAENNINDNTNNTATTGDTNTGNDGSDVMAQLRLQYHSWVGIDIDDMSLESWESPGYMQDVVYVPSEEYRQKWINAAEAIKSDPTVLTAGRNRYFCPCSKEVKGFIQGRCLVRLNEDDEGYGDGISSVNYCKKSGDTYEEVKKHLRDAVSKDGRFGRGRGNLENHRIFNYLLNERD